ncbi:MAG: energy transducer TonB, partial [Bacteroidales bacterium]|nr:energy transducer TonB [Bacteroidales bacterium]
LVAFEWSTPVENESIAYRIDNIEMVTDLVPIQRKAEIRPPMPKHFSKIQLIPDDQEATENFEFPSPEIDPKDNTVYSILEQLPENEEVPVLFMAQSMPEFPGGKKGLQHYISKNISYPIAAIENDIQGKVFVRFIVNSKGNVERESVIRSIHPLLDKEALRVVRSFPSWKPGSQNGRNVSVWYTVPIVFKIN